MESNTSLRLNAPIRPTRAYINTKAIAHNINLFKNRVPGNQIMVAVKANGYGHGIQQVAQVCAEQNCAFLAVATLDEYLTIRDFGIDTPVLILQELTPEEADYALVHGARLSCGSVSYAKLLSTIARTRATQLLSKPKIHINIDTGIGRMGLYSTRIPADVAQLIELPELEIEGIYTHFATSDEQDKSFAWKQLERFESIRFELESKGLIPRFWHAGNTGALIDFPHKLPYNLARPGVGIYGMYPSDEVDHDLELHPAMELVSQVVKVTQYQEPWTIGYGRTYQVNKGSRIGVVPIGYGDGYRREFSNKAQVICRGQLCPVVGRVSMDMITIDLSHISGPLEPGEPVVLLGSQTWEDSSATITAEDLAGWAGTITYEITCGISARVPRIYR
jgi:alanine racemase